MIGRPASAYGTAAAAARDASLRLRHNGLPLCRDDRSPSPRSGQRRATPSTSVSDLRSSLLHRLRLRRAAGSPPTGTIPIASDERGDVRRVRFYGVDGSPPPPSSPAPASAAREAIDCAIRGMASLSPSSASTTDEALQRPRPRPRPRRWTPSPPLPRDERPSASSSAIRGTGLSPSSASATQEGPHIHHLLVPPSLPSPLRGELYSASTSCAREVSGRTLTASSPQISLHGLLLTHYQVPAIATLRASNALPLANKPRDAEISGPILVITNPEFAGSTFFCPYTMRAFTRSNFPIDIMNVLYSDGDLFLLKEGTSISVWEVKSETSLCTFQLGVHIEQGYFRGTPASDLTIVVSRQRVFAEQNGNVDDEDNGGQEIVAEFWLRRSDGGWQQNAVVCAHMGMHSLIIHDESLCWLSDNGTLCSVTQTEQGLVLAEWEGAVESVDSSFALLEHLNDLYIVKSGGILPNAAAIYRVVPGDPPAFPETRLNGKDVFIVHGKSGLLFPNQTTDSRVFSAPLIEDADCSRFSYRHNRHDNIRPCPSEFFHHWCFAAWAVMQTSH